jgi:hypothetical protein
MVICKSKVPLLKMTSRLVPSGEQLEVVVQNHQAVCGGERPHELREYERLSE